MARAVESETLKQAINDHLSETREQVARVEQVFSLLKVPPKAKTCKGMQGLIEEGVEAIEHNDKGPVGDLAIIGAAQRVEYYEISAYGTARALAEQVGNSVIAKLLQETEDQEKRADEKLSTIAGEIYESGGDEEGEADKITATRAARGFKPVRSANS